MPKNARERELARAAAKREEDKRAARRRQSLVRAAAVLVTFAVVVAVGFAVLPGNGSKEAAGKSPGPFSSPSPSPSSDFPCDSAPPPVSMAKVLEQQPPEMAIDASRDYTVTINTGCGMMKAQLFAKQSPVTVNNFVSLVKKHWYNGLVFHRVANSIDIIQTGDPNCTNDTPTCGQGGPGYSIPDEYDNGLKFKVGSIAMANTGAPDTGGSQFFIITGSKGLQLPPEYTIFGQLIGKSSLDTAQKIQSVPVNGETPTQHVYVRGVKIFEKKG